MATSSNDASASAPVQIKDYQCVVCLSVPDVTSFVAIHRQCRSVFCEADAIGMA